MARFAVTQGSQTAAIGTTVDLANFTGQRAIVNRTDGAVTLTAAQFVNAIVMQSGTPGAFNMTTPTAAQVVAAIPNCQVGSAFEFIINNAGDNTITVVAGTGVTLVGTTTVATSKARVYRGVVTAVDTPAVSLLGIVLGDK